MQLKPGSLPSNANTHVSAFINSSLRFFWLPVFSQPDQMLLNDARCSSNGEISHPPWALWCV